MKINLHFLCLRLVGLILSGSIVVMLIDQAKAQGGEAAQSAPVRDAKTSKSPAGSIPSPTLKSLGFDDGACSYRLRFDPRKYPESDVRNTANLLFKPEDFGAPIIAICTSRVPPGRGLQPLC
jgi:hypothetical protein